MMSSRRQGLEQLWVESGAIGKTHEKNSKSNQCDLTHLSKIDNFTHVRFMQISQEFVYKEGCASENPEKCSKSYLPYYHLCRLYLD